jgi:hypothetical protein
MSDRFVTDGGLETDLIFHPGVELPCFAAFPLLDDAAGRTTLTRYFAPYADADVGIPLIAGFTVETDGRLPGEVTLAEAVGHVDGGDPCALAEAATRVAAALPALRVVGGCCGTDVRHVAALWGVAVDDRGDTMLRRPRGQPPHAC